MGTLLLVLLDDDLLFLVLINERLLKLQQGTVERVAFWKLSLCAAVLLDCNLCALA